MGATEVSSDQRAASASSLIRNLGEAKRNGSAFVALGASLVPYALLLWLFPATGDQDAAIHALFARFPAPIRVLGIWARPLFAVPYLLPGKLGYPAMRVFTVLLCAATAWMTYAVARRIGLGRAWAAIPLTLLQPALFQLGTDTMTEPIFAFTLAAGLLAFAHDRLLLAAAVWSFLPLARPEGPFILALLAALWLPAALRDGRRRVAILLLPLGMVVWAAACLLVTGSLGYLLVLPWAPGAPHLNGPLDHYIIRWPHIIGLGALPLWLLGLWPSVRQPVLRLCVLMTAALFVVHTILFAAGLMGSLGFDRYFATIAPAIALVATAGVSALEARRPRAATPVLGVLFALQALHALVSFDSKAINHMGGATLELVREAERRVELAGRPLLAADHFAYVFADNQWGSDRLPSATHDVTAAVIDSLPAGTVVLWDDLTGDWWYHLSVEDFTARGYRLLWERHTTLGSAIAPLYERARLSRFARVYGWIGEPPMHPLRQAVLVRE